MSDRRQFIKTSMLGLASASLAYQPCLNAKTLGKGASAPKRFVFIRKGNGLMPDLFNLSGLPKKHMETSEPRKGVPSFEVALDQHDLPDWLEDLHGYKEHMTILQGLSMKMCELGHKSNASVMCALDTQNNTKSALLRTSIDFELAKLYPSPLGHVELSFAGNRSGVVEGFSVPAPYKKNFCYADPITAYRNLFKAIIAPDLVAKENSTLDYLKTDQAAIAKARKGRMKGGYENYLSAIEAVKNRNRKMTSLASAIKLPDEKKVYAQGGQGASLVQRQDVMTDVLVSALVAGMTNVVTYTIDDLLTPYTGLPGMEHQVIDLHKIGHGKGYDGFKSAEVRELIRRQHMKQIRKIVDGLKAQPEGDGTMFDNTMVIYFPEAGDGHHGEGIKPPLLVLSGKNCNLDIAGRYIRLPHYLEKGHQTLGNWYTTLLNAHGNPIKHYGNLDGHITGKGLAQEGAIKRFIRV